MQELLPGSWGQQIVACSQQYPRRVFAAVLVAILLLDLMFRKSPSSSGGGAIGGFDFGDGDGCGE